MTATGWARCLAAAAALWCFGVRAQAILDTAHLPAMRPGGAAAYRDQFLTGNLPRAWAIASDGSFGGSFGGGPIELARDRALKSCAAKGGTDCALYAEDLDVVWHGQAPAPAAPLPPLVAGRDYAFAPDARFIWHGPQAARGVLVWGHGYGGPGDDERGRQPPAFLRPLNNAGFDVVRFDRDPRVDGDLDQANGWLRAGLADLRRQGWRQVIVGGQSRGGWNALAVLETPGLADAVITTSAGPGTGTDPGAQILKGETMLYSLTASAARQATRVVYVQFRDDPYGGDKDKRARRMRDLLAPKIGGLLLIDQPAGFSGHFGASGYRFAERFGACIAAFVTAPVPVDTCDRAAGGPG